MTMMFRRSDARSLDSACGTGAVTSSAERTQHSRTYFGAGEFSRCVASLAKAGSIRATISNVESNPRAHNGRNTARWSAMILKGVPI